MEKIHNRVTSLDEETIRKIAAGEVVERPASVVKELMENAIDAGSLHITAEIERSGKEMIRISDNGSGMTAEDALLALERHTTSKIRSADDLQNLSTFGFRGEALPSIASVSKMELVTRSDDTPHGTAVTLQGGKIDSQKECGRAVGTTITVREIFFNTPARLKFLKSDVSEKSKILRTFEEIAIAHPHIRFEFKSENRFLFELPARADNLDRILDLWEGEFTRENLIPISFLHPSIQIEGWVSNPQSHQSTKSYQIFYVNKRPIISRSIAHALYESYRDCLPVGRHPAAVLSITLNPADVDVNVHPSKREVRFRNESQIYESILREIRLKRSQESPAARVFSTPSDPVEFSITDLPLTLKSDSSKFSFPANSVSSVMTENRIAEPEDSLHKDGIPASSSVVNMTETPYTQSVRVLAQFHSLYVIAEQGENLLIVDQHAAAERVLYEQFKKELLVRQSISAQPLLIPVLWNCTHAQTELLKSNQLILQKLGFRLEQFGEKTFRITEAPSAIPETELKNVMDEILSSLENQTQPTLAVEEKIMHSACRAAIKANDRLSVEELSELMTQLSRCDNPHTCPHGRPTKLVISRKELDRKFGRT